MRRTLLAMGAVVGLSEALVLGGAQTTAFAAPSRAAVEPIISSTNQTVRPGEVAGHQITVTPLSDPDLFLISGDVTDLRIGDSRPIELRLGNPNNWTLSVTGLAVAVGSVDEPHARRGCTLDNYVVTQYTGRLPLIVPPDTSRTLRQLGVAVSEWPTVAIPDLPHDQTPCLGADVSLEYSGTGELVRGRR